jgi:hypothetical protein
LVCTPGSCIQTGVLDAFDVRVREANSLDLGLLAISAEPLHESSATHRPQHYN